MLDSTCPIHGDAEKVDGHVCTCWKVTFIVSDSTSVPSASGADWLKHLEAMRNWKVALHGQLDGMRTPVPDAFQEAFETGELDV